MDSSISLSADHPRTGPTSTSFVSEEPSSAFETPMSSCRSGAMLTGAADVVNAQLLLSAQQSLREAFPCSVVPHSLATFTMLSKEPCQHEIVMPKMSSLDATTDICDFMRNLEPHGYVQETHAEASDQPGVREETRDSDEESVSSMGDRHTRKRKRQDQSEICINCSQRAGEAAAAQQHFRSMCDDLAAQNAVLRSQVVPLRRRYAVSGHPFRPSCMPCGRRMLRWGLSCPSLWQPLPARFPAACTRRRPSGACWTESAGLLASQPPRNSRLRVPTKFRTPALLLRSSTRTA